MIRPFLLLLAAAAASPASAGERPASGGPEWLYEGCVAYPAPSKASASETSASAAPASLKMTPKPEAPPLPQSTAKPKS